MKKILFIISVFIYSVSYGQDLHSKAQTIDTIRSSTLGTAVAGMDTAYFFGTSIVFGYNLDNPLNRWTSVLSRRMGVVEANFGVNSATLMKRTPINPWGAVNFLDNLSTQVPTKTGRRKYVFIAYGINDARWNTVNYDTVNFKADYRTALNYFISTKGWLASDITLVSPEWCKDPAAFIADHVSTGNTQVTTARYLTFVDAVLKLSIEYGTHYVDVYTPQRDGLGNKGYADNVHFNPGGSQFYADVVFKAATTPLVNKETQNLAVNGLSEVYRFKIKSPDTLTNYFTALGLRQSDNAVGVVDLANLVQDAAINNRGVITIDSQQIGGVKQFQNNMSVGPTIPAANIVGTINVYSPSVSVGGLPTVDIQYGGSSTPSYSSVGFVPAISANTAGRIAVVSGSGGMSVSGFGGAGTEDRALSLNGYSGITSPTNAVVSINAWKSNGSSNRAVLASTEPALQINNGTTPLINVLGNGWTGYGRTPTVLLDVYNASATTNVKLESGAATGLSYYQAINNSTGGAYFGVAGGSFAGFGSVLANMTFFEATSGSAGLVIQTNGTSGSAAPIIFNTNNAESARFNASNGDLLIGTATDAASAKVNITSTTQGFLPPRMTTTQRNAVSSPATGLTLYCTDCTATDASTGVMQTWNGSAWKNNW